MTQILLTLEDSKWLNSVVSALNLMRGVKVEIIESDADAASNNELQSLCGAWKGSQTAEETLQSIVEARTSTSYSPEL